MAFLFFSDVQAGDVYIADNTQLCHWDTIIWTDVLDDARRVNDHINGTDSGSHATRICEYHTRTVIAGPGLLPGYPANV